MQHEYLFDKCSAVHCQRFSGGEDDGDPEEEARLDGESVRLHR